MADEELPPEKADVSALVSATVPFSSKSFIESIKTAIKEGNVNPLAIYTVLKRNNKVAEEIFEDKEISAIVLNEAEKYLSGNQKSFKLYGATICKMAVHTWYDFSGCGHPVLDELYKIRQEVEARIKALEEELKLLIPKETKGQMSFGIQGDTKTIVVEKMPFLRFEDSDDQVVVQAPKKIQREGLKFMKI